MESEMYCSLVFAPALGLSKIAILETLIGERSQTEVTLKAFLKQTYETAHNRSTGPDCTCSGAPEKL